MSKKVLLNDKYELGKGIGSWAQSIEIRHVEEGTTRFIGGILMYAYTVYQCGFLNMDQKVNWRPVDEKFNTNENLRNWINTVND